MDAESKLPIPAVFLPSLAIFVAMIGTWIESGTFDKTQLALAVTGILYALIGYPARGKLFQRR